MVGGGDVDVPQGASAMSALLAAMPDRAPEALAVRVNGDMADLSRSLEDGDEVEPVFWGEEGSQDIYRHTASHVMAQAVLELFPGAKLAIGPAVEDGFYYDFELPRAVSPEDLSSIEERMAGIVEADMPLQREVLSREAAVGLFRELGQRYKVELLEEMEEEEVTLYRQGDFVDLCRGPHLPSTGRLRHFKLLSLAGAYWRGDEKRPMLQRIYGTAFDDEEELERYLRFREEAERRDHRRLGRELDLFSFHEEAGPGVVFYHPKGAVLREVIEGFLKEEHRKRGYLMVYTPHLFRGQLWHLSGHMDYYRENMYFFEKEGVEYVVKPMNCPGHLLIYKTRPRSYRDLPLKYFELGTVYRYERSGVLHGLMRVRGFTQDDAHIICTEEQLEQQVRECLEFAFHSLRTFGFEEFDVYLSTRPEKSVGGDELWGKATRALKDALEDMGIPYEIDPGEGVFYGPKIDVKLKDAIGRSWQGPTVQADFNLPERFDLTYTGPDNRPHRPVMIHRVVLAGIERFYGVLLEHYAGEFPLWLAPVQAVIVPVADRHLDYARGVMERMSGEGLRAEVDDDRQTVNMKIRRAQVQKVPFTLVVGDREVDEETVSVRDRAGRDVRGVPVAEVVSRLAEMDRERKTDAAWE